MKILLIAAGRSTRLKPIADKNQLRFFGKPLLAWQIEGLVKTGSKDIAVVGGKHNLEFLKELADKLRGVARLKIFEQENLDHGMAGAVLAAKSWIAGEPFLLVSGNDMIEDSVFEGFKKHKLGSGLLLAKRVKEYFPGGYLVLDGKKITKIMEKPGAGKEPSDLVNIVVHYHPHAKKLLQALEKTDSTRDDRYELALQSILDEVPYEVLPFEGHWQPIKYPWHILEMLERSWAQLTKKGIQKGREVSIAKTAVINGPVRLEDGVKVLDHAVIQGPAFIGKNSIVATNALVRGSHIGENCVIGFGSEVARSYLGDGVWTHTNYIGDSVVGDNVSFGAGTVTGNLRLDEGNIFVSIGGQGVDSGKTKFGAVIGDNVRIGINTSLMPGVKIGSNSMIGAGLVIDRDIEPASFVKGEVNLVVKKNKISVPHTSKRTSHGLSDHRKS